MPNHAGEIAAIDFFVVPTLTFRRVFVFDVMGHERWEITHVTLTRFPSAAWTAKQMIEAFPFDTTPRYVIRIETAFTAPSSGEVFSLWESNRSSTHTAPRGRIPTLNV